MADRPIAVPRDNPEDKKVTRDVEAYLLDMFSVNNEEPFTFKEVLGSVRSKFSSVYGWDLEAHVAWALDMLHTNHLVKRVGPGVWEADEGPDDVYSERETGYAPEGEFVHRGKNFNVKDTSRFRNKVEYNQELFKAEFLVKTMKNMGKTEEDIYAMLQSGGTPFNPVAIKIALKKHFQGVQV